MTAPESRRDGARSERPRSRWSSAWALLLWAGLSLSGAACVNVTIPEDSAQIYQQGVKAQSEGQYRQAILDYSRVLERHPGLVEALLARGDCRIALAEKLTEADEEEREQLLMDAVSDFAQVSTETDDPEWATRALLRQGATLRTLGRRQAAIECFEQLLAVREANRESLGAAHESLGELRLSLLHDQVAIAERVSANRVDLLDEVRRIRKHFGEALEIDPGSPLALFGKGSCLLHEGLPQEAEKYLARARDGRPESIETVYLLGVARERIVGPNQESNSLYLRALRLDVEQSFAPLYLRAYPLLETEHTFSPGEVDEILRRLIEYRGESEAVWREAESYFAGNDSRPLERLGSAVTHARFRRARQSLESYQRWAATEGNREEAAAAIELVFMVDPSAPILARAELALARAEAYRLLYDGAYPQRPDVWSSLRTVVSKLEDATPSPRRDDLYVRVCAHFAEDLLAAAENENLATPEVERLLQEVKGLTLTEQRLVGAESYRAEFRLGQIERVQSRDSFVGLTYALQSIKRDPTKAYTPAYAELARAFALSERDRTLREINDEGLATAYENALLEYKGDHPAIVEVMQQVADRREKEAERRAKEERERMANEEKNKMRAPCVDCGHRAERSETFCPKCGSGFDSEERTSIEDGGDSANGE